MQRKVFTYLHEWKKKSLRKPLIIRGARQVGKTWIMKEFSTIAFPKFAYINFESSKRMQHLFENDFDISRIITALQLESGIKIDENTLIILDEIQEAPALLHL